MPWRELEHDSQHWDFIHTLPQSGGLFLQSPAWVEFQRKSGHDCQVLGWWLSGELKGVAVLVRYRLPFGYWYWFVPKGPRLVSSLSSEQIKQAHSELMDYGRGQGPIFLRWEPGIRPPHCKQVKSVNPRATCLVDLRPSWEEILGNMHEKTRYNIRLAQRKGLQFNWGGLKEFDQFWSLLQTTAKREHFRTHQAAHYRTMFELFGAVPIKTGELAARLGLVMWQNKLLAASLVIICNKQATYLHGASSRECRELMAPYLLHGEAMRQLKEIGCQSYDLWGVQPKDGSLKTWAGFTRFKLGFGGKYMEDPGTFDYPYKAIPYLGYQLLRRLR